MENILKLQQNKKEAQHRRKQKVKKDLGFFSFLVDTKKIVGQKEQETQKRWDLRKKGRKNKEELRWEAYHDTLTNLPNRNSLIKKINNYINQNQQKNKTNLPERRNMPKNFSVVFIDIDNFKQINDTRGHDVGDKVLQEVANILKESIREEDFPSRIGGDEFVLLVNEVARGSTKIAEIITEYIIKAIQKLSEEKKNKYNISASAGICSSDKLVTSAEGLLKKADQAMYFAKENGKNKYAVYSNDKNNI